MTENNINICKYNRNLVLKSTDNANTISLTYFVLAYFIRLK